MTDRINQSSITEVRRSLESSRLGGEAFEIKANGDGYMLKVLYRENDQFKFIITAREASRHGQFESLESPGQRLVEEETHVEETFDRCFTRVAPWLRRVEDEVIPPVVGLTEDELSQVFQYVGGLAEPETPFDAEQLHRFEEGVEETLRKFQKEIESLKGDNEKHIGQLRNELANLRQQLETGKELGAQLPKRSYSRKVLATLLKFGKSVGTKGVTLAIDACAKAFVQHLLGNKPGKTDSSD